MFTYRGYYVTGAGRSWVVFDIYLEHVLFTTRDRAQAFYWIDNRVEANRENAA